MQIIMHPFLIILLFICVYVGGAPNFIGNGKFQSRLKTDLEETESEAVNSAKPVPLFNRETINDSKRKRCENCRNLKACKVHQRCDICNIACKDIDLSQLQTSESIVGETQEKVNTQQEYTIETTSIPTNSDKSPTVENISLGPRHNLLAKILNNPKKDEFISSEKSKTGTAKIFKQKTTSDDNTIALTESNLQNQKNTTTEEKKKLLKDLKSPKDELEKIINHAKALHARVSNREGLLKLRSRSILNKDEATSNEASKEKNLLGNRSTSNKEKHTSIGLRRRFPDKPSNVSDTVLPENFANKEVSQQEPEEVQLPLQFPSTPNENVAATLSSRSFNTQNSQQDLKPRGGVEDTTHSKDSFLSPEKFSLILQNLERKVENIADLVRETCRYPVSNLDELPDAENSPSTPFKKKLLGTPLQEDAEDKHQPQKGISDSQNKLISLDSGLAGNTDNKDDDLEGPVKLPNDNTLKESPMIMSKSQVPETNLKNDQNQLSEGLPIDKANEPVDQFEELPNTEDLLITESSHKLNDGMVVPKPGSSSHEKMSFEDTEKDNFQEDKGEDERSESPPKIFDPKLQLHKPNHQPDKDVFNAGSRSAEEDMRPLHKHHYLVHEPHRPVEPMFDKPVAESRPHDIALGNNNDKSLERSNADSAEVNPDDSGLTDKIHFEDIKRDGEPVTPIPSLEQRFAEDENKNLEESDPQLKETERMVEKTEDPQFGMVGKIIPQDPKSSNRVLFVSDGMKLPFNMKKQPDGSYQLSVDVEKLCPSCNSGMCKSNINNVESTNEQIQNNFRHKIIRRDLKQSDDFSNFHKKRKPFPVEKKRPIKIKRSIDSNSYLKSSEKLKTMNNLLNDSFDAKNNVLNEKHISDKGQNNNKIEKQKFDVIQQRIDLLSDVLTWWKSFIENKA